MKKDGLVMTYQLNRFAIIAFVLLILACGTSFAQNTAPTPVAVTPNTVSTPWPTPVPTPAPTPAVGKQLSDEELKPLVSYLKKFVKELTRPIHLYHYFDAQNADPVWRSKMSASDPLGYRSVYWNADGYWRDQGTDGGGNMMGRGMYFALDPVATRSYGGGKDYVLVRVELPKGIKVFDVTWSPGVDSSMPAEVTKIYETLGCTWSQFARGNTTKTASNMMEPKHMSDRICIDTLKKIIDRDLRVDVLAYSYSSSVFKECLPVGESHMTVNGAPYKSERQSAFVLMSNRWVRPELVRLFNRNTSDATEERLRIQSMYYKSFSDQTSDPRMAPYVAQQFAYTLIPKNYVGMQIIGSNWIYNSKNESYTLYSICPTGVWPYTYGKGCQQVSAPDIPPQPYPITISAANPPMNGGYAAGTEAPLMWNDLEGKQTDANVGAYIQKTQYGCSSEPDLKPVY